MADESKDESQDYVVSSDDDDDEEQVKKEAEAEAERKERGVRDCASYFLSKKFSGFKSCIAIVL